jgi:hypothetical protein
MHEQRRKQTNKRCCDCYYQICLQEKVAKATKQKVERRKKPKSEEQEGMPQHQHCPPAKHHGDRKPKYHEEEHKDFE